MLMKMPSICGNCGKTCSQRWPLGEMVCDECLVKNFTLEEALTALCSCFHNELRKLYAAHGAI